MTNTFQVPGGVVHSRFPVGKLSITFFALHVLTQDMITSGLKRHAAGDWGDVSEEDRAANERALLHGGRLFSAYHEGDAKYWIITEADRSETTLLLPDDY